MDADRRLQCHPSAEQVYLLQQLNLLIASYTLELCVLDLLEYDEQNPPKRRRIRERRWYTRPWIVQRQQHGHYEILLPLLRTRDPEQYRKYLRVEPEMFDTILERIRPRITKMDTCMKICLDPGLKLAVTLRFLVTGNSYKDLSYSFLCGFNSISEFVPEVCEAIIQEFMQETIVIPTEPEGWKVVADGFLNKWNFHHTIGAIDGKHVAIVCPAGGGSEYYNYKGYHSIILMGVVDADGKFLYVDVGSRGTVSDGGIFGVTPLRHALEHNVAGVPPDEPLPGEIQPTPYFLVGDNAFPMRKFLQKPYGQRRPDRRMRNFNYRLSRARRVVENAFGMLAQRFRLFLTTINVRPKTVEKLIIVGCILHNMLRTTCPNLYPLPNVEPDAPATWRLNPLDALQPRRRQRGPTEAKIVRDILADFYMRDTTFRRQ